MVEAVFEEVRTQLERNASVKLSGFGNFQLRDKAQRPGCNPKTGEDVPITGHGQASLSKEKKAFNAHASAAKDGLY